MAFSPHARILASIVTIEDFQKFDIGIRKFLAKLTPNYESNEIVGWLVLCLVNLLPRQIGKASGRDQLELQQLQCVPAG